MNNETQICPTCKQRIDPGAGYRLLSIGEIRTAGDEFYNRGEWRSIRNVWLSCALKTNSAPTRRKILVFAPYPGNGYRLLSLGEIFRPDDEVLSVSQVWHSISLLPYDGSHMRPDSRPTRRKIPVSNHDHATDSGQRACSVCSGGIVGGGHVVINPPAPPVFPGFGYRLLEIGETIRKSDEALAGGRWQSFTDEGKIFDGKLFFFPRRRKIEVPPATRIVTDEPVMVWAGRVVETRNLKAEAAIYPGEGYRLLELNEILEVGDELLSPQAWEKFFPQATGTPLCPGIIARRKILPDPGAGYRWLKVGETIQMDDEAFIGGKYETYKYDHGKIFDGVEYFIPRRRKLEIPLPPSPNPGAGYRLLKVGEVRQRGDEYFSRGNWSGPTMDVGFPVWDTSMPYRRKVGPKQYRLLSVGELTKNTDEIWNDPSGDRPGVWMRLGWRFSVVTYSDPPVRREIDNYIGGPA